MTSSPGEDLQLGVMKHIGIGTRGDREACLWFDCYVSETRVALIILDWPEARKVIEESRVYTVAALEGHACWVKVEGSMIRFVRVFKP